MTRTRNKVVLRIETHFEGEKRKQKKLTFEKIEYLDVHILIPLKKVRRKMMSVYIPSEHWFIKFCKLKFLLQS